MLQRDESSKIPAFDQPRPFKGQDVATLKDHWDAETLCDSTGGVSPAQTHAHKSIVYSNRRTRPTGRVN